MPGAGIDNEAAEESEGKVRLMPEYLVVCCWRSIKEVSLLLGELTATAPIVVDGHSGLLDKKQVR